MRLLVVLCMHLMSWRTGYTIFIYTKKLKTSPAHFIEQHKRNRIEHLAKNYAF